MINHRAFHNLDVNLKNNLIRAYKHYETSYEKNIIQFKDVSLSKQYIRKHRVFAIQYLPDLIAQFEKKFTLRGGKVYYAKDFNEVFAIFDKILSHSSIVVKSKSMVTEEIELNKWIAEAKNAEVWETDLGEFIVQQMGQKPAHITAPAIHLSKEEIFTFFQKRFGIGNSVNEVVEFVRKFLRKKFLDADVGITGANFLIADVGAVAITENEGNAGLSVSYPKIHIILTTPDKIIPTIRSLALFWPMLATHGTGQKITAYNHLIFGAPTAEEIDGPKEVHLILLDAKRSEILKNADLNTILTCIHCGACLTVCPIFQRVGGHAFNSVYAGPMGSILSPLLFEEEYMHEFSSVCTLCGACSERCPVEIPLDKLLIKLRIGQVKEKSNYFYKIFLKSLKRNKLIHAVPGYVKNIGFRFFIGKKWNTFRHPIRFPKKTFTRK
jgi:L-lactate dehydrogenase complex protein LldF